MKHKDKQRMWVQGAWPWGKQSDIKTTEASQRSAQKPELK